MLVSARSLALVTGHQDFGKKVAGGGGLPSALLGALSNADVVGSFVDAFGQSSYDSRWVLCTNFSHTT